MTLDGTFQLARSSLQLNRSRWVCVRSGCTALLETQAPRLSNATDVLQRYGGSSSHELPNAVAAVAECASHFPELVRTRRAWSCCARYV
jgi:hypothetical protein